MDILLVENSAPMRKLVATIVKRMGFEQVFEAQNGVEVSEQRRRRRAKVDLVLTDTNTRSVAVS